MRAIVPAMAAIVLMAGCTTQDDARPEPAPAPAQGTCGAEKLSRFIGMMPDGETQQAIQTLSGAKAMRVVGPDSAMTMDYREDRLTITTGADGKIQSFRCV